MSLFALILIVVLILVMFGALPSWPYSARWGYGPTGLLALLLVIVLILLFAHRI